MYGSTSVRWIVHTLMPNRQPSHTVAINLAAILSAVNVNLDVAR